MDIAAAPARTALLVPGRTDAQIGLRIWAAACALIGVRFCLHGRDAAHGLDCVGLVALALRRAGHDPGPVPTGYGLRDHDPGRLECLLAAAGLHRSAKPPAPGDIALLRLGPRQCHLAVIGPETAVHAHLGLRRVVESPLPLPGAWLGHFGIGQCGASPTNSESEHPSWQP